MVSVKLINNASSGAEIMEDVCASARQEPVITISTCEIVVAILASEPVIGVAAIDCISASRRH